MKTFIAIASLAAVLSGCADLQQSVQRRPLVDMRGVNPAQYQQDYSECAAYAAQIESNAGANALAGAVVFGILGAMLGDRHTAAWGAGLGAASAAGEAENAASRDKTVVMRNCLKGRNYIVLF